MLRFFQLLLRPTQLFFAQWIAVSTEPTAFAQERIRLGDTTNFLRAVSFFLSAISTAFLAEVATLYLLGIGGLAEPYYWLFILLTSIRGGASRKSPATQGCLEAFKALSKKFRGSFGA
jgi:hypothetical protein